MKHHHELAFESSEEHSQPEPFGKKLLRAEPSSDAIRSR